MKKLLLLLPLSLIAGCAGKPKLTCTVEMDTRDTFDGRKVELEVSSEAKPGRRGYGKIYLYGGSSFQSVELPYLMGGQTAAKLPDGRVLYLSSCSAGHGFSVCENELVLKIRK